MPSVTGPFFKTRTEYGGANSLGFVWPRVVVNQSWYRSLPRRSVPLQYRFAKFLGNGNVFPDSWGTSVDRFYRPDLSDLNHVKAYERLKGSIGETSSLGVNLAEYEQSVSMIANRAGQLLRSYRALRRGNVGLALREVGLSSKSGNRFKKIDPKRVPGQLSSIWLELHFGWVPLMQDIFNATDVLQRGLPPFKVRGRAKFSVEDFFSDSNVDIYTLHTERCQLSGRLHVTNPNLLRANQLGLTNPAVIVWELVPFSFVVDWFLPVGNFLSQSTDLMGLDFRDSSTTFYTVHTERRSYKDGTVLKAQDKTAVMVQRDPGLLTPPLVPAMFKGFSLVRGATAVALLIQQLKR